MKISVALATYNGEKFIKNQLESIIRQTRVPDEIVICDDCSNDSTIFILEKYLTESKIDFKIIRNQENKGAAFSFKKALENCRGDIIMFCDQDDIWLDTKVEKFESAFKRNSKASFIISDAQIINSNGDFLDYTLWKQRKFKNKWQKKFKKKMQFEVFLKRNIFTGMTTAIKSNLVNLEQPNKYPLLHDAWYIPVSLLLGQHGILINEPLTLYRQHSKQLYGAPKKNFKIKPIQYKIDDNISLQLRILNNLNTFSINNNLKNENVIMLREKIDHLNYRLFIRKRKIRDKTFLILKEFIKGNYNKYSSNYSALFDFIL